MGESWRKVSKGNSESKGRSGEARTARVAQQKARKFKKETRKAELRTCYRRAMKAGKRWKVREPHCW